MKHLLLIFAFIFLSIIGTQAQTDSNIRKEHFNLEKNLAIDGYDPVAYHTVKKAVEGKKAFQHTYNAVTYRFSSQKNLDLFKANPSKYEPAYGGWCAYAMGENNEKVNIDPETFKVTDGVLYLFYNRFFTNTLPSWNEEPVKLKKEADKNWKKFIE